MPFLLAILYHHQQREGKTWNSDICLTSFFLSFFKHFRFLLLFINLMLILPHFDDKIIYTLFACIIVSILECFSVLIRLEICNYSGRFKKLLFILSVIKLYQNNYSTSISKAVFSQLSCLKNFKERVFFLLLVLKKSSGNSYLHSHSLR